MARAPHESGEGDGEDITLVRTHVSPLNATTTPPRHTRRHSTPLFTLSLRYARELRYTCHITRWPATPYATVTYRLRDVIAEARYAMMATARVYATYRKG